MRVLGSGYGPAQEFQEPNMWRRVGGLCWAGATWPHEAYDVVAVQQRQFAKGSTKGR